MVDHQIDSLRFDRSEPTMMQREAQRRKQRRREKQECPVHSYAKHGKEAEELRTGVDKLCSRYGSIDEYDEPKSVAELVADLRQLLDDVDARDSLAYLERIGENVASEERKAP